MSTTTIRPVRSKSDTNRFIKFLWRVYEGNSAWVPPLLIDRKKLMDKEKNPFYRHADAEFYLAEKNGEVVGRIAAIVNHNHIKEHNENIGFFGFFECVNDQSVANALFDTAAGFLRLKGVKAVRGPANPSVNDEYGLLIEGFDRSPTVLMPYNPAYYPGLVEGFGFRKIKDLYSYLLSQDTVYSEKMERVNTLIKQRHNIVIRSLDMKRFREELNRFKDIYNIAWMQNWGAVPMTNEEIEAAASDLKAIIVPEVVLFAESKGKTIGFALSLPDINIALKYNRKGRLLPGVMNLIMHKREINLVRVIALGVLPEYQNSGAAGILFYETAVRAKRLGYQYGEAGWVLEDNVKMVRAAETMKGEIVKKYRLYEMPL